MPVNSFAIPMVYSESVSGTLSTSTKAYIYLPFKCRLVDFAVWVESLGGTSGATTVVLKNGATTLHNGVSIAYNASNKYVESSTFASSDVNAGTWITAEVTAVPTSASSGLHVQVFAVGLA